MTDQEDGIRSRFKRFISRFRNTDQDKATEEALSDLESEGLIDHDESEMMQGVLFLDKTTVRDVMVPRTEVAFVDKSDGVREIVKEIIDSGHSRLPVVDESLDHVIGFVHAKDLLLFWGKEEEFELERVMRKTVHVPETKKLDDLLAEFQESHEQLAVVIDEFGGTSGLVSIEDILEEIVGEIEDEYDRIEYKVFARSDHSLTVPGRFEMEKMAELLDLDEFEGPFNTVGGWVFERIGRVPESGEKFEFDGLQVTVESATERQIRRVRISKIDQARSE